MVRILIALRRAIVANQLARTSQATLLIGAGVVLLSAVGTIWLGLVTYPRQAAATDVLALAFLLWVGGRVAQSALAGDAVLRPEVFALLPLDRRRLARSLLIVGLLDPAGVFMAIAFCALIARAAGLGAAAAGIAVVAVLVTLTLASVLATIAGAVLGPGSRRGHDVGTIVTAVALSVIAVAATLLPALDTTLRRGSAPWLADALTWLPTGWGPDAVQAAAGGSWLTVVGTLAGLVALTGAAAVWWPAVLSRRMDAAARPAHAGGERPGRWSARLRTPAGAVTAKEIRMWVRDPIRLTCLLIALIVGAAVCAIPRLTSGSYLLLPYAGILTAIIAGACACNLYGSDGTSLWLTVMAPDASRADVRGRQAAWLIVVAPYTVAISIVCTALSGVPAAWPWVLAILPAILGGAAGLAPLSSLISVQPLDETGGPTPAYSLKVHIALVAVTLAALVPVAFLVAGHFGHQTWLTWTAVPIGLATGVALTTWLGALAVTRLETRQVAILRLLADASR